MSLGTGVLAAVAATAFVVAWVAVLAIRELALRRGMLDLPNERSSHVRPTPRLGGLGILVAVLVAVGGGAGLSGVLTPELLLVLALGGVISLVSVIDDVRGLSPLVRLPVHLGAAVGVVTVLGSLGAGPLGADGGVVAALLTGVWIAGFINAFNFMDGTDGIAAAQATVAASGWAVVAWSLDQPGAALLAAGVAAASAGFLLHNWAPASIFMGDVGSAFLGLLLAALPLLLEPRPSLLAAALPVWPFVCDTSLTLIRRARRGENLLAAHRSHLYQRLTHAGWAHWHTAVLYALLALAGTAVAVPMATGRLQSPVPALALIVLGPAVLWLLAARQEARHRRGMSMMPVQGSGDA